MNLATSGMVPQCVPRFNIIQVCAERCFCKLRTKHGRQTRKSPIPVPPIPDLAGNRGRNPRFPIWPESGNRESPIPDFAGNGTRGPDLAGRGFPGLTADQPQADQKRYRLEAHKGRYLRAKIQVCAERCFFKHGRSTARELSFNTGGNPAVVLC